MTHLRNLILCTLFAMLSVTTFFLGCSDKKDTGKSEATTGPVAIVADFERYVPSGHKVSLHGFASETEGDVRFDWRQTAGDKVKLNGADTNTLSFTAPVVEGSSNEVLGFALTVTDAQGQSSPRKVSVEVLPENSLALQISNKSRRVAPGDTVTLHATGSGGEDVTWHWEQIEAGTDQVDLKDEDTANPSFVAPQNSATLRFRATFSAKDGRSVTDTAEVIVVQPHTAASTLPLSLISSNGNSSAQQTAPQVLMLAAPPDATAVTGTSLSLTMPVTGGAQPYTWLWEQIDGTDATLSDTTSSVVQVDTPSGITTAKTLTFQATITDADGTVRKGTARVRVVPQPGSSTGTPQSPVIIIPGALRTVTSGMAFSISTDLTNPTVTQSGGSEFLDLKVEPISGGGATINITPPIITTTTEQAEIVIEGKDQDGKDTVVRIPIRVLQNTLVAPPTKAPPVVPPFIPNQVPSTLLEVISCGAARADEGQADVALGACASGGDGSYTYQWTAIPSTDPNAPVIQLKNADASHPTLDIPKLDANTILRFQVEVTSGSQKVTADIALSLQDLGPTLDTTALADIAVVAGHQVSLHKPQARGGIPPYTYSLSQTDGTTINNLNGENPVFTAPDVDPADVSETLEFEYVVTDSFGNTITARQLVIVSPAIPLTISVTGPSSVHNGQDFNLHALVAGGTAPYTITWQALDSSNAEVANFSIGDGDNPTVTAPTLAAGDSALNLRIFATVTDSSSPALVAKSGVTSVAGDGLAITVDAPAAAQQPSTEVVQAKAVEAKVTAALEEALQQSIEHPEDLDRLVTAAAQDIPRALRTSSITTPEQLAKLNGHAPYDPCDDKFLGSCVVDFNGMCDDEFVQDYCPVYCDLCTPATPELKLQYERTQRAITEWMAANPTCHFYLQLHCP